MKEKDIQTIFGKKIDRLGVYELKLWKGPSFPFDKVEKHQEKALILVEGEGLYHKISDYSPTEKPFDCFFLNGIPAYVVVVHYIPRKVKMAYFFRINDWIRMKKMLMAGGWHLEKPRKSMTVEHARYFSVRMMDLR